MEKTLKENKEDRFTFVNDKNELETIDMNTGETLLISPQNPHLQAASNVYVPYTVELGEAICTLVREGNSYKKISERLKVKVNLIYYWKNKHPDFSEKLAMARKDRADHFFDKIYEDIAEGDHEKHDVPGKKLQFDAYRWMAEKSNPEQYGNQTKIVGDKNAPLAILVDTGIRRNEDDEDETVAQTEIEGNTREIAIESQED